MPDDREITDCGGDGCEECNVCCYLNFCEWAEQVAPPGESTIQRDPRIEAYLDATYPCWRR